MPTETLDPISITQPDEIENFIREVDRIMMEVPLKLIGDYLKADDVNNWMLDVRNAADKILDSVRID